MNITCEANTLIVQFPYNPTIVERIKTLPTDARRWDGKRKAWTVPVRYFDALRELFPSALVDVAVDATINQREELATLATSVDAEIDVPGLGGDLLPFQRGGLAFLDATGGRAIVGDEMGLGKTVQALAYLQLHPELRPAVIVVPASLKLNWEREAGKWLSLGKRTAVLSGRGKAELPDADLYIINYDIVSAWLPALLNLSPAIVICDEAHYLKTQSAQRTKATRKIIKAAGRVVLLSGTPITNRPKELWPLLNTIAPDAWPDFFSFARRYCNAKQKTIRVRGGSFREVWDFDGASNLPELHNAIRPYMVRRLKADVLKELPAKRRVVVPMELSKADRNRHTEILERTRAAIKEAIESDGAIGGVILAQIEELKQDAVRGKLPLSIEWIREFIESEKLIVFATHKFVVAELMAAFGKEAVQITGDTGQNERQAAVDRFQNDDSCRLFVGNIKAAGVGLTLTAASNVAFLELAWTPADHDQAEDRAHRIGQTDSVTAWYLLAADTIDEDIFAKLEYKRRIVSTVTDGTAKSALTFDKDLVMEVAESLIDALRRGGANV